MGNSGAENPNRDEELVRGVIIESFITREFGDVDFIKEIGNIGEGEQKRRGVILSSDGSLLFDEESLRAEEKDVISEFIKSFEDKSINDHPYFQWYFKQEDSEYLERLVDYLKGLTGSISNSLKNMDLAKDIVSGAEYMKDSAMKKMVRRSVEEQMTAFPFSHVIVEERGVENDVEFTKDNFDKYFDFIYINSDDGPQLVVSTNKNNKKMKIVGFVMNEPEGKFEFDEDETEKFDKNKSDMPHWKIGFNRGSSDLDPIFSSVILLEEHLDIKKTIEDLIEEREAREMEERRRQSSSQPSVSRSSRRSSFVSSG